MKFLLPAVVLFLVLCQVFGEELGPKEDLDYWTGSNQIQVSFFFIFIFDCYRNMSFRLNKSYCNYFTFLGLILKDLLLVHTKQQKHSDQVVSLNRITIC